MLRKSGIRDDGRWTGRERSHCLYFSCSGLKQSEPGSTRRRLCAPSSSCTGRGLFTGVWLKQYLYLRFDELIHKQSVGACHNHGLVDIYTRMRLQRLEAGQSASGLRGPHSAGGLRDVQAADISRQDLRHLLRHP